MLFANEAAVADIITGRASLWDAVCAHGNGNAVAMPAIGGGQSRLSHTLGPAEAIRLQVLSFWLASRERPLSQELVIVVQPQVWDQLDRRELQAFLTSLKPS